MLDLSRVWGQKPCFYESKKTVPAGDTGYGMPSGTIHQFRSLFPSGLSAGFQGCVRKAKEILHIRSICHDCTLCLHVLMITEPV